MSGEKKTFSITPTCTKCGHSAELFIDDEGAYRVIMAASRERILALWRPMMVKRIMASWGVLFVVGFCLGRFFK